jgi:tRNA modification GTPase
MADAATIFALASGPAPAGVAMVRVSGAQAGDALLALSGLGALPSARLATRATLRTQAGDALDDGLVLWFPAPASFTGEDVAEFHIHGGRAVIEAVLAALGACAGLRMAEAGEFTRRAFINGKLDLTAVEGLADLIAAETEAQRRQAHAQAAGELGRLYDGWREKLVRALAHAEATIDFADDEVPEETAVRARLEVSALDARIADHLADGGRGERLRHGLAIVVVGRPNAGKSSIINALVRREVAIVAPLAGTTRDIIEAHLDLGGYPVTLVDTAGLREAGDALSAATDGHAAVEAEGIRRALERARAADVCLVVVEAGRWPAMDPELAALIDERTLIVISKTDLVPGAWPDRHLGRPVWPVSVVSGSGMAELVTALALEARERCGSGRDLGVTRERHRQALEACRAALGRFVAGGPPDLAAEDLRVAVRALGRITGRVDVEELLDTIFRDFCIGK